MEQANGNVVISKRRISHIQWFLIAACIQAVSTSMESSIGVPDDPPKSQSACNDDVSENLAKYSMTQAFTVLCQNQVPNNAATNGQEGHDMGMDFDDNNYESDGECNLTQRDS